MVYRGGGRRGREGENAKQPKHFPYAMVVDGLKIHGNSGIELLTRILSIEVCYSKLLHIRLGK